MAEQTPDEGRTHLSRMANVCELNPWQTKARFDTRTDDQGGKAATKLRSGTREPNKMRHDDDSVICRAFFGRLLLVTATAAAPR